MRPVLVYVLAATLSALPVLAQRHHGGGGGGFSGHGGGNSPKTFITITSAAPAATSGTGSPSKASPSNSTSSVGSSGASSGSVDASLIPPFGITAGIKATDGTVNCVGDGGKDIQCDCPPDLNTFVGAVDQFVASGLAFPSGDSAADQLTRLQTCIVTLQNFRGGAGSGVGCPAVSTTWNELQAKLQSEVK